MPTSDIMSAFALVTRGARTAARRPKRKKGIGGGEGQRDAMRDEAAFRGGEAQGAGERARTVGLLGATRQHGGAANGGEEGDGRHGAFSGKRCRICPERLLHIP